MAGDIIAVSSCTRQGHFGNVYNGLNTSVLNYLNDIAIFHRLKVEDLDTDLSNL